MDEELVREDLALDQDSKLSPPRREQEQVELRRRLESREGFRDGCCRDVERFSRESNSESPSSISSRSLAFSSAAAAAVAETGSGSREEIFSKGWLTETLVGVAELGGESSIILEGHLASGPFPWYFLRSPSNSFSPPEPDPE